MSICKEYEDLILTDFIDGELNVARQRDLITHLNVCPSCRALALEVKKHCVAPFANGSREEIPSNIWENIKCQVDSKNHAQKVIPNFLSEIRRMVATYQFAPAVLSFLFIFVMGTLFFNPQSLNQVKEQNLQEEVVYELSSSVDSDIEDLGTPLEKYFL